MRIAIDAMGGEGGVALNVPASIAALEAIDDLALVLVGHESLIQPHLQGIDSNILDRIELLHTDVAISDEERPAQVIRGDKRSSIYLAVELAEKGSVQAMVSAGNTGALLMAGRHLLKTIPGIQKPAIVATLPGLSKPTYLLDVGANPDCTQQQLFEFAVMGSVLAESINGHPAKVGLLNIGSERHKGTGEVKGAAEMLHGCAAINYLGFVEANDLFRGKADVVVCDGFVGNVTIKSSAGVANVVNDLLTSMGSDRNDELIDQIREQINPQRFNGAILLGLQGSIVKSHGNATLEGFCHAIYQAVKEVEQNVPHLIAKKVAAIMGST
jgi:glycerol-3-phosphate acyltransferase PlsX|tara:strand:- start:13879 stop:14859 length:981 start_codon:yes stop_codon:yes gene_type:complete